MKVIPLSILPPVYTGNHEACSTCCLEANMHAACRHPLLLPGEKCLFSLRGMIKHQQQQCPGQRLS